VAAPSEKDIIMVQNQLRGFNARAKVNRVRAEKEAAKHGDPAAAAESAPDAEAPADAGTKAKATIPPDDAPVVADSTSGAAPAVQGTVDQPAAAETADELAAAPKLVGATEEEVVIVQNQLRGFIARAKVRRVRAEKEAAKQGVLSATKGTVQGTSIVMFAQAYSPYSGILTHHLATYARFLGEPGWYKTNDQLFYFCMDKVRK
jgi:2-C-methyl-D-erythritol 4-phosphate cytidylyltransferase